MTKGIKRTFSVSEAYAPSAKRRKAASKIQKFMKRTVGNKYRQASAGVPELKYNDSTLNVGTSNAGGSQLITTIAQGSDNTERIGRKITNKALQYDIAYANGTTDLGNTTPWPENYAAAKFAIVWDKQPNGALATWADVYNTTTNVVTPMCFKNYNNIDRFDILAVEDITICVSGPNAERRSRYIPLSLETRFDGTGSTVADIQSGALIIVYADNNASGAGQATLQGRLRILYSDD